LSISYSVIKETALSIAGIIDELANQEIKSSYIRKFWNWFFTSHARTIIMKKNDSELKQILEKSYKKLKPIFETTDIMHALKDNRLNSAEMNKKLMQLPNFAIYKDLLE